MRVLLCYVRLDGRNGKIQLKFVGIRKGYARLGYPTQAQASAYSERFKERDLKKTIRPLKKQGDKHTLYIIYVYILKHEGRASVD